MTFAWYDAHEQKIDNVPSLCTFRVTLFGYVDRKTKNVFFQSSLLPTESCYLRSEYSLAFTVTMALNALKTVSLAQGMIPIAKNAYPHRRNFDLDVAAHFAIPFRDPRRDDEDQREEPTLKTLWQWQCAKNDLGTHRLQRVSFSLDFDTWSAVLTPQIRALEHQASQKQREQHAWRKPLEILL